MDSKQMEFLQGLKAKIDGVVDRDNLRTVNPIFLCNKWFW